MATDTQLYKTTTKQVVRTGHRDIIFQNVYLPCWCYYGGTALRGAHYMRSSSNRTMEGQPIFYQFVDVGSPFFKEFTSSKGGPICVYGDYSMYNQRNLTSLVGGPIYINGSFDCRFADLKSLEGMAMYVGKDLYLNGITCMEPTELYEDFPLFNNMPYYVGGSIIVDYDLADYVREIIGGDTEKEFQHYFKKFMYNSCKCTLKGDIKFI